MKYQLFSCLLQNDEVRKKPQETSLRPRCLAVLDSIHMQRVGETVNIDIGRKA